MTKYTAVDLEMAIMKAWQIVEDVELLYKHYADAPHPMSEDEVMNALLGIISLGNMRMWELNDMHARVFELNQYCTDPDKLAARDLLFKPKKGSKK